MARWEMQGCDASSWAAFLCLAHSRPFSSFLCCRLFTLHIGALLASNWGVPTLSLCSPRAACTRRERAEMQLQLSTFGCRLRASMGSV